MARYSITGTTTNIVASCGGQSIKEAKGVGVIFADLSPAQVEELRKKGARVVAVGGVKTAVTPPTPVEAAPSYSPNQLAALMGSEEARNLSSPPLYGSGYNLAVIDSGIRETHEQVMGRVVYSKNYTSAVMRDGFSHGTAVCSIALAVAPQCNILNMKVLDDKGEGTEEAVVMAIDDCIDMVDSGHEFAPHVINLSLGSEDTGDPNNVLRVACRAAIERRIYVSAAAGNSGPSPGTILCPACEKYVFATGSVKYLPDTKSFVISEFSSRGPTKEGLVKPDAVMFGEDIIVASSESDTATAAKSGTSFAAPFSSGVAILYIEGTYRVASYTAGVGGTYPGFYAPGVLKEPVTMEQLIDKWLPVFCVKPAGVSTTKDTSYGQGLPFGPLVLQAVQSVLTGGTASVLINMMPVVAAMMLIPVVMRSMD
jgi:serine protease AprX